MLVTPKCVCFPILAMGLCLNPIYSMYLSNAVQLSYCLFVPAMILQQEVFLPIHICVWHLCVCTRVGAPLLQISRLFSGNVFPHVAPCFCPPPVPRRAILLYFFLSVLPNQGMDQPAWISQPVCPGEAFLSKMTA